MRFLIIARHRDDERGGPDSEEVTRVREKLTNLKARTEGGTVRIFTSPKPRAVDSAQMFHDIFGGEVETHDFLLSADYADVRTDRALDLIESAAETDVVIITTHLEYTAMLPSAFGERVLGASDFPRVRTQKGEAYVIDCAAKVCTLYRWN